MMIGYKCTIIYICNSQSITYTHIFNQIVQKYF